jgi:Zn-dependent peptidase ImmA (M78 family)
VQTKASLSALELLERYGIDDPTEIPLDVIARGIGAYYEERPLNNSEGRMISFGDKALITINSNISIPGKKRYAIAHEIGHFEMHRNSIPLIVDTEDNFVDWLKTGPHEKEANEFAAEFLMPRDVFAKECKGKGKRLSPELIRSLAARFQTSLTSTLMRYVEFGNHEVCLVYCKDNKMGWFKKSTDFHHFLNFQSGQHPPTGSVAYEMFTKKTYYEDSDQKQQVWKSDWFVLKDDEPDLPFFEFCVYVPTYHYSLSLIWEENKKSKHSI